MSRWIVSCVLVVGASAPCWAWAQSAPWWDPAWQSRVRIEVDTSSVTEPLVDFPVLVRLTPARFDAAAAQPTGADLRWIAADGITALAYELERFDPAGESWVWVRLPRIDPAVPLHFWLYSGNPAAPPGENPDLVWDSGFLGVWHLAGDPSAPAPQMPESSGSGLHADMVGATAAVRSIPGRIGLGVKLDGSGDYASAPGASLDVTGPLTCEAWIRPDAAVASMGPYLRIVDNWSGSSGGYGLMFDSANTSVEMAVSSGGATDGASTLVTLSPGSWYYLAGTFDPGASGLARITVTGPSLQATASKGTGFPSITPSSPGVRLGGNGTADLNGALDEVRISGVARSPAWIQTQYLTMTDSLLQLGPPERYTDGGNPQPDGAYALACDCTAAGSGPGPALATLWGLILALQRRRLTA